MLPELVGGERLLQVWRRMSSPKMPPVAPVPNQMAEMRLHSVCADTVGGDVTTYCPESSLIVLNLSAVI